MGANPGASLIASKHHKTMHRHSDLKAIKEIETRYALPPIRGAREQEIEIARGIRARSIAAYEDYLHGEYRARNGEEAAELERDISEAVREAAAHVFPYADAYIIQLQLLLSRSAAVGVVPLSDDQLTEIGNPVAAAAWGEISMREYMYRLQPIAGNPPGGRAAVEAQRIKRITEIPEQDNRFNVVRARLTASRQNKSLYN